LQAAIDFWYFRAGSRPPKIKSDAHEKSMCRKRECFIIAVIRSVQWFFFASLPLLYKLSRIQLLIPHAAAAFEVAKEFGDIFFCSQVLLEAMQAFLSEIFANNNTPRRKSSFKFADT